MTFLCQTKLFDHVYLSIARVKQLEAGGEVFLVLGAGGEPAAAGLGAADAAALRRPVQLWTVNYHSTPHQFGIHNTYNTQQTNVL